MTLHNDVLTHNLAYVKNYKNTSVIQQIPNQSPDQYISQRTLKLPSASSGVVRIGPTLFTGRKEKSIYVALL